MFLTNPSRLTRAFRCQYGFVMKALLALKLQYFSIVLGSGGIPLHSDSCLGDMLPLFWSDWHKFWKRHFYAAVQACSRNYKQKRDFVSCSTYNPSLLSSLFLLSCFVPQKIPRGTTVNGVLYIGNVSNSPSGSTLGTEQNLHEIYVSFRTLKAFSNNIWYT